MTRSLRTMVLHLYPNEESYLQFQFQSSLSPAKWLWNKPSISDYSKAFPKVLAKHREIWWNRIIIEIFDSENESSRKRVKSDKSKISL